MFRKLFGGSGSDKDKDKKDKRNQDDKPADVNSSPSTSKKKPQKKSAALVIFPAVSLKSFSNFFLCRKLAKKTKLHLPLKKLLFLTQILPAAYWFQRRIISQKFLSQSLLDIGQRPR